MPSGVTYRLSFKDDPHWAIGSTTTPLNDRKLRYWHDASTGRRKTRLYELIREVGPGGFDLTEVDRHYFADVVTLRQKEQELLDDHMDAMCLNIRKAYESDPDAAKLARVKIYRKAHLEERRAAYRAYDEAHREERRIKNRDRMRLMDPEERRMKAAEYTATHKEERKAYKQANREKGAMYSRNYRQRKKEAASRVDAAGAEDPATVEVVQLS